MNFSDITLLTGVKKVFFIGFLANVDESILKLKLDYDYQLGENNRKITILKSVHNSPVVNELYHLEAEDISLLTSFMCGTDLPFKNQILEVALENFELSYSITHKELRFLCLMISLEVLFNPHSQTELTYQISRSAAIIIGNNKGERTIIF